MGKCIYCNKESIIISDVINACVNCIRNRKIDLGELHLRSRAVFGLQVKDHGAIIVQCNICGRNCSFSNKSYCGYRVLHGAKITPVTNDHHKAVGMYYYDPHPTNCVATPVCPAVTGIGYPKYALYPRGEHGYYNIAVFYGGCNMDCLYCQNWEYRDMASRAKPQLNMHDLVKAVNERTTCVCFFGGDPGPFAPHALIAAREMRRKAISLSLSVFRICWETNGLWNPLLFKRAIELSLESGGIVKVDLKAWSPEVYSALCNIEEKHVHIIRENIKLAASYMKLRGKPPILVISTLLVPGYIDEYEIDQMTRYIAGLNPEIPYVFLGFHPDYLLVDLPRTSRRHVEKAMKIAHENGLKNVWVGNVFLLGNDY